jgi:hypothetical protein
MAAGIAAIEARLAAAFAVPFRKESGLIRH